MLNIGLGALLSQGEVGSDLPIAGTTLNTFEQNLFTIENEFLSIILQWLIL